MPKVMLAGWLLCTAAILVVDLATGSVPSPPRTAALQVITLVGIMFLALRDLHRKD